MKIFNKNNSGFTLIELLVVVAIVALLASIVITSLNTARAKGRDAKRLQDLEQVRNALELYYNAHGQYPTGGWFGNCPGFGSYSTSGPTGYIPNLAPTYISILPLDPKPTSSQCYVYKGDGTDYEFLVFETVEGTVPASLARPGTTAGTNYDNTYSIYTPGGAGF